MILLNSKYTTWYKIMNLLLWFRYTEMYKKILEYQMLFTYENWPIVYIFLISKPFYLLLFLDSICEDEVNLDTLKAYDNPDILICGNCR